MKCFLKWNVFALTGLVGLAACGKNQFSSLEEDDVAEDAAVEMEKDNPEKAIELLEKELEKDPDNYVLISLLSAAYAQKYEVGVLDLALAMADSSDDDDEESADETAELPKSDIAVLWPYLPTPSDENLAGVAYAVDLLLGIPTANRTAADNFKLALLSVASVSLRAKSFDTNSDGRLSTQELLAMGAADAEAIISGILGAASAILAGTEEGENSEKAAEKITTIADDIENAEGETDEEKVENYFASQQS